ncbi:MAG TPA: alpha/beta hydrolase [Woeseiaceae bacterium]|nr:alpha/beta hydrolase [Woeseiaceae bacterium]
MSSDFPAPRYIDTNGIRMAIHEQGQGESEDETVVLCHGFPELAYSWRLQLPALADAGYRAIAPDQRGYGATDKPAHVADYDIRHLVGDMTGLLDTLGLERAWFVGHDWGALLVWQMALLAPERMRGVVAVNIPFYPRPPADPVIMMRRLLGPDFYIVNFQDSDEADRHFAADPERYFRAMMRRLPVTREAFEQIPDDKRRPFSMLTAMDEPPRGEDLLSEEDLQVFVEAFRRGGFTGPINWYRNWTRNWELTEGVEQRVRVPALFVGAEDDVLIAPHHIEAMRDYVDDLEIHRLGDCGHWTQQERPEAFNAILLDWLARRRQG